MPVDVIWGDHLPRLLLTLAGSLLGGVVFLIVINRLMNYLRDGAYKLPLAAVSLLATLACFGGLSYALEPRLAARALAVGFAWVLIGEIRQVWLRRRSRAEPPLAQHGRKQSWRRPLTTTDLQVLHYQVALAGWRGPVFRVVHLSDLHLHHGLPWAYFEQIVEQTNQAQADMVFITGDYITGLDSIQRLPELLQRLHSRCGVYGMLGNHDYWADAAQVREAAQRGNVQLVGAGGLGVDLGEENMLWLVGCEAPWSGERMEDLRRSWAAAIQAGRCVVALSHSADYIYPLSRAGVRAVFSGHYHAGQFQLPWVGPLLTPSRYGRLFYRGHFQVNGTRLFVSAGIGCAEPALRLYCPPELLVIDFSAGVTDPGKTG